MAIILHIDTAVESASVCLAVDKEMAGFERNTIQKEHSSWLHPAIDRLFKSANRKISEADAIAVTIGPGSYTGLRVGMAAAKGLCFSLNIPLIGINTLELMARQLLSEGCAALFIIPVIDARRMEVFTAVYNRELKELKPPHALIVDGNSYEEYLGKASVAFTGDAVAKLKEVIRHDNVLFSAGMPDARAMAPLAAEKFARKLFSSVAYTEPLYVKEFYQARN